MLTWSAERRPTNRRRRRTRRCTSAHLKRRHRPVAADATSREHPVRSSEIWQALQQRKILHVLPKVVADQTSAKHHEQRGQNRGALRAMIAARHFTAVRRKRGAEGDRHEAAGPMSSDRSCAVRRRQSMFFQKIATARGGPPTANSAQRRSLARGADVPTPDRARPRAHRIEVGSARSADASIAASSNAASVRNTHVACTASTATAGTISRAHSRIVAANVGAITAWKGDNAHGAGAARQALRERRRRTSPTPSGAPS